MFPYSGDVQLPKIIIPRPSASPKACKKDSLILLSLITPHTSLAIKKSPLEPTFPVPLKQSEITQILEAAKKSRDDKIAASMVGTARTKRPARRTQASKFASVFVSPRASLTGNRSKYPVPQQTVEFQGEKSGETTEIIDLETSDATSLANQGINAISSIQDQLMPNAFQGENTTSQPHLTVSRAAQKSKIQNQSMNTLHGQNTRSQPHLSTSPFKKAIQKSKPVRNQRLRRSRSHARINSDVGAEPAAIEVKKENQAMSMSMEDMSESSSVEGANAGTETSTSRPIVKKPNFAKQNSRKQQVHSVYTGRPYVTPVARRLLQQTKSPQHKPPKSGVSKSKRVVPLSHYPHPKKRHNPLTGRKQELPMPRGNLREWLIISNQWCGGRL
jgi:hypothetical protein